MSKENNTSCEFNFSGLLVVVFIVLKLTKVIDLSWYWVLAPILIPMAAAVVALVGYLIWYAYKHGFK